VAIGGRVLKPGRPRLVGVAAGPGWEASDWSRADILEIRLDHFPEVRDGVAAEGLLEKFRSVTGRPLLLTIRSDRERETVLEPPLSEPDRLSLFARLLPRCDAVDVEIGAGIAGRVARLAREAGKPVIGSYHNFRRLPPFFRLEEKLNRAEQLGAAVFKAAVRAEKTGEVFQLLDFCRRASGPHLVAAVPVGGRSPLPRLLAGYFGSVLVYAALGRPTAAGQPGLAELAEDLKRFYR